jgi:hypothetical protein
MREPDATTNRDRSYLLPKDAAELKNINIRTLYDWLKKRKITSNRDDHGQLILSESDLQDLDRFQMDTNLRKNLVEFWVQTHHITPQSARNRLRRKLQKGENLISIARSEQGFHEWLSSRISAST